MVVVVASPLQPQLLHLLYLLPLLLLLLGCGHFSTLICEMRRSIPAQAAPAGGAGSEEALDRLLRDFKLDPAETLPLLAAVGVKDVEVCASPGLAGSAP